MYLFKCLYMLHVKIIRDVMVSVTMSVNSLILHEESIIDYNSKLKASLA